MFSPLVGLAAAVALLQQPQTTSDSAHRTQTAVAAKADRAPVIDGRDNDEVWQRARRYSDFRQFQPKVDIDPTFKTEFRAAYDDRNLYVFVRMFDPHPDSIMHSLSRRDVRGPSDQIKLLIDSYHDKRTGYELAVNPDGVKRDYAMSGDGNEDDSWNGIWDVATTVDSLGWTAEFRVPLSQLRYSAASSTFGFGIWRDIERLAERESWPLWSPNKPGIVSQLGEVTGLVGLSSERRVEVTPYTVTKNVQRLSTTTGAYSRQQQITGGGDIKVGITPNVTLDGTINPDFGQVEADPSVVNLTAYETFFQERRPFFVEGTGLYRFELNCYIVVDCSTNEGLFYSRRIGRSPLLRGLYGDEATPTATAIAAATKLTGRTGGGFNFGILDAVTPEVNGTQSRTVEPLTNFAVVRVLQDLKNGDADISFIGTAVNRSTDQWTQDYMHKSAFAGGASFRDKFGNRNYEVAGHLAASRIAGTATAIAATQTNGVHFFQQPGDKVDYDPSRTSLSGYDAQLKVGKYSGGITRFESSIVRQSAGFDVNDLGYLRRADRQDWDTWAALSWQSARSIYRWAQVNGNHWETWNTSGTRLENAWNFNGHMGFNEKMGFLKNWDAHMGGTVSQLGTSYCDRCTRGGPVVRTSRGFFPWGGFNTDSRRTVAGGFWYNGWFTDEGKSTGFWLGPYVQIRPSQQLSVSVGPNFSVDHNDSQWFGNFTDASSVTHYTFAHIEQRTNSMTARVNYTATPNLTFELYGQPFIATGTYSNLREVTNANASSYDARFSPYAFPAGSQTEFKVTEFRSNSVMRWEYRPGSTLFVVWQHGREGYSNQANQQPWTKDYRELFDLHPDNTFLVKVAYWLSR